MCALTVSRVLQVLQGYVVTAVAWLYWSRYVSILLPSWARSVASLFTRTPSEKPKDGGSGPLKRLLGYMRPYFWRFVFVLTLVVVSSYGEKTINEEHVDV